MHSIVTEEADCELSLGADTVRSMEFEIGIFLHPTYHVISMSIHTPDDRELPSLEDLIRIAPSIVPGLDSADHRRYEFGTLLPDLHPLTGLLCLSFHACDIKERIGAILGDQSSASPQRYALVALSLLGPYVGLTIPPHLFRSLD